MSMDSLLEIRVVDGSVEEFLTSLGEVFVVHRGHDSGNTSYGVRIGADAWFVKHAEDDEPISHLESAIVFHTAVRHPAIIPLVGWFAGQPAWRSSTSFEVDSSSTIHWRPARQHPNSTYARFRHLPVDEIIRALDAVFDAHVAIANAGFVAVDFYDGAIIYNFQHRQVHLCDLDSYRPGPYRLHRDRQYGSTRFMAPEELERGATIDERTTVFTLGRAAFVFLSEGQRGENDMHLWRGSRTLYDVARAATELDPDKRFASVTEFLTAWRTA